MKRIFILAIIIFFVSNSVNAQQNSRKVILEANVLGKGMVLVQGEHLYLRVFDDGQIEYGDVLTDDINKNYFIRKAKLSSVEFESLTALLNGAEVQNLVKSYPPVEKPIDYLFRLTLTIQRSSQSQTIVIHNFSFDSPKPKTDYPKGLVDLMCRIENLRTDVYFRVADESKACCSN